MDSLPASSRGFKAGDFALALRERLLDPLYGRRSCGLLSSLLKESAQDAASVERDLRRIVETLSGRRLSRRVVGPHPTRQSLTDFYERGESQASRIRPYLQAGDTVLEYRGGIGRLGRALAPHVARLVSVDVDPLMKTYGAWLAPGVDFRNVDELPEAEVFDGAYSIAVFFHLSLDEQRRALEYVHKRLKPGGWFLVDVLLGDTTDPQDAPFGDVHKTGRDDFRSLYEPLFSARRVQLFNSGFLLRKETPTLEAPAASAPAADGRYAVNEVSVVFDVLEGEVVVVNLDNGAYYILEGLASAIWQMLAAGQPVPEIIGTLSRHYPGESAALPQLVADFVSQLSAESLIGPATGREHPGPAFDEGQLGPDRLPFAAPAMFRYTDMQALIQMDPIREYDETGWPRRATQRPKA